MEGLKEFSSLLRTTKNTLTNYQNEIDGFHYGLQTLDTQIANYKNILSGKTELPKEYSKEDIQALLEKTEKVREEYISEEGKRVSQNGSLYTAQVSSTFPSTEFVEIFDDDKSGFMDHMRFDYETDNIYGEINRVSSYIDDSLEGIDGVLKAVDKALKELGEEQFRYEAHHEQMKFDETHNGDAEKEYAMKKILEFMNKEKKENE